MIEVNNRHDVTQLVSYLNSVSNVRYFACFKQMIDRVPLMEIRIKHYYDLIIGIYDIKLFSRGELDNIIIMCNIAGFLHDHIKEVYKCEKERQSDSSKGD